jgi:Zn-dependent protease
VAVVFLAVLFHEMGHALVGRRFGLQPEVHLIAMGGITVFPGGRRMTHGRSILVSFAGPAVGLVIGGAALAVTVFGGPLPLPVRIILGDVVWTNLGWAIFNLVPIVGLDGGNIMAAAFDRFFGRRGLLWARIVSIFVGGAICAWGIAMQQVWLVLLIGALAIQNYRAWQIESQWADAIREQARAHERGDRAREAVSIEPELQAAWAALEAGDVGRVLRIAEALVPRAVTEEHLYQLAHLLAWGRLLTGDPEGAWAALDRLPPGRRPDALLEGAILLELGRPDEAVRPLAEAIVDRPDDFVAVRLAKAVAASGRFEEVLALLRDRKKAEAIGARALQIVATDAFYAGHHDGAALIGQLLFEHFHQASDAFNVACSLGQAGKRREALEWLEKAVEAGLADPTVLDTDVDLAPVRSLPEFQRVRAKAGLGS